MDIVGNTRSKTLDDSSSTLYNCKRDVEAFKQCERLLKTFSTTEEMLRLRIRSTIWLIQLGTRGCSFPTPLSCGYPDTVFARHRHRVQVRASRAVNL